MDGRDEALDRAKHALSEWYDTAILIACYQAEDGTTKFVWSDYGNQFAKVAMAEEYISQNCLEIEMEIRDDGDPEDD